MGECGCGNFNPDFRFKGPNGITYILQIYQSCPGCNTPAGIILHAFNPAECRQWDCDQLPEISIDQDGLHIAVISPETLMCLIADQFTDNETAQEICEMGITECFQEAVFKQIENTRQRLT